MGHVFEQPVEHDEAVMEVQEEVAVMEEASNARRGARSEELQMGQESGLLGTIPQLEHLLDASDILEVKRFVKGVMSQIVDKFPAAFHREILACAVGALNERHRGIVAQRYSLLTPNSPY